MLDHIHELFKTNKKSLPYTCFSEKNDIFYTRYHLQEKNISLQMYNKLLIMQI